MQGKYGALMSWSGTDCWRLALRAIHQSLEAVLLGTASTLVGFGVLREVHWTSLVEPKEGSNEPSPHRQL